MNDLERIQADLLDRIPDLTAELDPPSDPHGLWVLDIRRAPDYFLTVEYRPGHGFGLATPKEDDYGSKPDEYFEDLEAAMARIIVLVETRGETLAPLSTRLAELRARVGISQEELARRSGLKQSNLSRFESQEDMKLSTLNKFVVGLGGTLSIVAKFPDGMSCEFKI